MLVKSVSGIFVLMDSHLGESLGRANAFQMESFVDGIFKFCFDRINASNV